MNIATIITLLATLAIANAQSMRSPQEILDLWSRPHEVVLWDDTFCTDTIWVDTVNIAETYGCPDHFAIWMTMDTLGDGERTPWTIDVAFEQAKDLQGPYKDPEVFAITFTDTTYGTQVHPFVPTLSGNYMRFRFATTDTIYLKAVLWMRK